MGKYKRPDFIRFPAILICMENKERHFTQIAYYEEEKARRPGIMVLMRDWGDCYHLFGKDAENALPIVEKVLTHEVAGMCYTFSKGEYDYSVLGFGIHNLDKVLPNLLRADYRVTIVDYIQELRDRERKGLVTHPIINLEVMQEKTKPVKPIQQSLFDIPGFFG